MPNWRAFKIFTKQHFIAIAKLSKESDAKTKYEFIQDLAKFFSEDNPRFDSKKFFKASGLLLGESQA